MIRAAALCALFLTVPTLGFAQAPQVPPVDFDRWGVQVSFTPKFEMTGGGGAIDKLAEVMFEVGDLGLDVSGSDFRIGVVRGRRLGGEWGVSYVHRSFDKESTQGGLDTHCDTSDFNNVTFCSTFGEEYFYTNGITMDGIEANKLINFITIRNVVQIGLDIAGGVGWLKGTAIYRETESEFDQQPVNPPPGSTVNFPVTATETEVPASTLMTIDPAWFGRVELAVGAIVHPRVKVRVSGGLNIPGTQLFSVTGSFFF